MSATYRAAYFRAAGSNSVGAVLTLPQHAGLPDDELRAEALAEAHRAGIVGPDADANQVSEADLLAGLHVGDWTD